MRSLNSRFVLANINTKNGDVSWFISFDKDQNPVFTHNHNDAAYWLDSSTEANTMYNILKNCIPFDCTLKMRVRPVVLEMKEQEPS